MKQFFKSEIFGDEVLKYNYTSNVVDVLDELKFSFLISTLKSNHLFSVGLNSGREIEHFSTPFTEPYGIAYTPGHFAIGCLYNIISLKDNANNGRTGNSSNRSYLPDVEYRTEVMKLHDLHYGENGNLWAVNSNYSCLCSLNPKGVFSFEWKPSFIDDLQPGDSCHLNGLAMKNKKPAYISALSQGNYPNEWRTDIMKKGILIDIESKELILQNLPIPHTPRIFDDQLYMLLSGTGEIICVDIDKGKYETFIRLPGFVRGMAKIKDYLLVGISQPRRESRTFGSLKIDGMKDVASVTIVHLPTAKVIGEISYSSLVQDIYDIVIYPNKDKPLIESPWTNETTLISSDFTYSS